MRGFVLERKKKGSFNQPDQQNEVFHKCCKQKDGGTKVITLFEGHPILIYVNIKWC